jgi:hypothetical protein
MGWTAHYQVLRATPLAEREIETLAELARRQHKQAWDAEPFYIAVAKTSRTDQVIIHGWNKISEHDLPRLEAALIELTRVVGGELRVLDDYGVFKKTAKPLDVEWDEFVDPTDLVAARPIEVTATDVNGLLDAHAATDVDDQRKELGNRLAQHDAKEVALACYARYFAGNGYHMRRVLHDALERLDDPTSVATAFLDVWRKPSGKYFYGDMPLPDRFVAGVARVPDLVEQWKKDVQEAVDGGDEDIVVRRAEKALDLLSRASIRPLVELIRERRGKNLSDRERLWVFAGAHRALAERRDPRAVPTLLHYIGSYKHFGGLTKIIDELVEVAPERVRPFVLIFARRGVYRERCIEWLRKLGGEEEQHLVAVLSERGSASIFERAIDVDMDTRHAALRELAARKDRSMFVSLVLAESLDKFLRARTDWAFLPFSWWEWKDILPDDVVQATTAKKLKWMDVVGNKQLGPQVIWPEVEPVMTSGAASVSATYPSETLDLASAKLAALVDEETAILAQL